MSVTDVLMQIAPSSHSFYTYANSHQDISGLHDDRKHEEIAS